MSTRDAHGTEAQGSRSQKGIGVGTVACTAPNTGGLATTRAHGRVPLFGTWRRQKHRREQHCHRGIQQTSSDEAQHNDGALTALRNWVSEPETHHSTTPR